MHSESGIPHNAYIRGCGLVQQCRGQSPVSVAASILIKAHQMDGLWGWERFFDELGSFITDLNRQAEFANESYCEYAVDRLEICIHSLTSLIDHLRTSPPRVTERQASVAAQYSVQLTELLQCLRALYVQWQGYFDNGILRSTAYSAPLSHSSNLRGRPKFEITHEQLCYLRSMCFSWVQIALVLGVSYSTIYRRRQEFGMADRYGAHITDSELREVLHRLRGELPSLGQSLIWGRLKSMGFNVTRERIRQAVRENDPIQTALRWRGELVRRQPYSVPGPNSLWHLGKSY